MPAIIECAPHACGDFVPRRHAGEKGPSFAVALLPCLSVHKTHSYMFQVAPCRTFVLAASGSL
jgi:hypothetical protein